MSEESSVRSLPHPNPLPPGEGVPQGIPVVCRLLRTKAAFFNTPGAPPWQLGESTTAVYWCLATMETAGPDDCYAHPHLCKETRSCFRPPAV